MSYSLIEAQEFYDAAKQGYLSALKMSEYSIKDRSPKRESIDKLKKEMDKWKRIIDNINAGEDPNNPTIPVARFVPVD